MAKHKKRTGDIRYLYERGSRWWVQVAVPEALQERMKTKNIRKSLGTSDVNEARRLRWPHVHTIQATFKQALLNEDMSADQIEQIAQAEYQRIAAIEHLDVTADVDTFLIESISLLAEELESVGEAVSLPDGEVVMPGYPEIDEIEKNLGVTLSTEKRHDLKASIIRAQINAFDVHLKRRGGLEADPIPIFNRASNATRVVTAQSSNGIRLADAIDEYVSLRSPTWAYKTRGMFKTSLRLFRDHIGSDKPLSEITRLDVSTWREKLRRLHPRWASSASSKGLPLDELLAKHGQGSETLSDKTLARHMTAIHGMFGWAIDTGHIDGDNKASTSGIRSKSKPRYVRGIFTDKEVCNIFDGLNFETNPRQHKHQNAFPWIVVLGAYTGARLEDICGLKVSDIQQDDGVWFLDIRDAKTPSGVRQVPIHSQIVALGFLDYVKAIKGEWLWPSLGKPNAGGKRGVYMGKVFATHCSNRGLDKPLLGYHYWRTTTITKLENAGVPENETARLVGHKIKTVTLGIYSKGLSLPRLSGIVEQIGYEGLELGVSK